jgi:sugar phosphate isomerase/epimerase
MTAKTRFKQKIAQHTYGVAIGNNLSLWKPYLFGGPIEKGMEQAKKWGYDAVELHNIANPLNTDVKLIIEHSKKYDIKISCISTGPAYYSEKLSLTSDIRDVRKLAVNRLKEYVDLAGKIGSSVTIGTMRGNIPDLYCLDTFRKRLAESLKEISCYIEKKRVTLLLEVANRYEINYLNRVDEIYNLIAPLNSPALKIHMDTFHMNIEEVDMCKAIRDYGNQLGYFHVADSNRMYPGAGHIDFKAVSNALVDINYCGFMVLECLPLPDGETAAKNALNYMKKIF